VQVLGAVIERPVLAVLHTREHLPLRRAVAVQLIRDDHARYIPQPLEEFAEERLRRVLVPTTLGEHIQDLAIVVEGPPQGMPFALDRQKDLIKVPFVARARAATP
jgi:hypothetical protein